VDQFNNLDPLADYWLPRADRVRCQLLDEHGRRNESHRLHRRQGLGGARTWAGIASTNQRWGDRTPSV